MSSSIDGTLTTKFGEIKFAITQADHVSLYTSGGYGDSNNTFVFRGTPHYVHIHLWLAGGEWTYEKEKHQYAYVHIRKGFGNYATPTADKIIPAEVLRAWVEFIQKNPTLLVLAEVKHRRAEMLSKQGEYEKLAAATHTADMEAKQAIANYRNYCEVCGINPDAKENDDGGD